MFELALKVTLILALGGLIAAVLMRASAAIRHLVWLAAIACVLLLPVAGLLTPAWHPPVAAALGAVAPVTQVTDGAEVSGRASWNWSQWVWLVWAGGALVVIARSAGARMRVAGFARRSSPGDTSGETPVRFSREVSVPLVCGILRPVILLPEEARTWSAERLRVVLAHEGMHLARRDTWTQAIAQLACALYWPHPLIWWAAASLHKECEQACDDGVLALGEKASLYAGHLVEIVRDLSTPQSEEGGMAMIRISELERRLAALLSPNRSRRAAGPKLAFLACALAAAVLLPLASLKAPAQTAGATLVGVVRDPSGAVVPSARVSLEHMNTNDERAVNSSPVGAFSFQVPAGLYTLRVEVPGFRRYERQAIPVSGTAPVRADVNLDVGRVNQTVRIQASRIQPGVAPAPAPAAAPTRIRVGGNVQAARLLKQPKPVYPEDCKAEGVTGVVQLTGIVSREGTLINLGPSANADPVDPRLFKAAMEAASQWRYQPTLLNGEPVEVVTSIALNFDLAQ